MISKNYLKAYDFQTMEDYFEYILLSKINGQQKQVTDLINRMSKEQKRQCLVWLNQQIKTEDIKYCRKELIKSI